MLNNLNKGLSILLGIIIPLVISSVLGTIVGSVLLQNSLRLIFRSIDIYAASFITNLIIIAIIYTIYPHEILKYSLDFSLLFTFIIISVSELTSPLCTYTGCEERYFLPFIILHKFKNYYSIDIDLGQIALIILLLRHREFIAKLFSKILIK